LSASAPLLQNWFARSGSKSAENPYFLYGASNLGSLLALLSYPTLLEPGLGLSSQSFAWGAGYSVLAACVAACIYLVRIGNASRISEMYARPVVDAVEEADEEKP